MPNKTLVVVESPGKVKKIQGILGSKYLVIASVGHIMDLKSNGISIDIDNKFTPEYEVTKRDVVRKMKSYYKTCGDILIATDEDREGEMIAWSVAYVLGIKDPKRMVFNSITKSAITDALKKTRKIDYDMVDAQKARRILDRLVGYKLSGILCRNIQGGLSAGRVQSVVTRLIIDRDTEASNFLEKDDLGYFRGSGIFSTKCGELTLSLNEIEKETKKVLKGKIAHIEDKKEAKNILKKCESSSFKVLSVDKKKSYRGPAPPFTTSTLQQDASRKLRFNIKKTMQVAQKLYESGFITYMRTDSIELSKDAMNSIGKYIKENYGEKYHKYTKYKNKSSNAQEAHEAVRPTKINVLTPKGPKIDHDGVRLYQLIWRRSVASQMSKAEFDVTTIQVKGDKLKGYYFTTSFDNLVFPGFLKVYGKDSDDKSSSEESGSESDSDEEVTSLKVGSKVKLLSCKIQEEYKKPPPRFDEASLVNILDPEKMNIGRPATYASIIGKIQNRGYVELKNIDGIEKKSTVLSLEKGKKKIKETTRKVTIGSEKKKFVPTKMGITVTDYLVKYFKDVMDYKFTADMELGLDKIASGKKVWYKILQKFWDEFSPVLLKLSVTKTKNSVYKMTVLGKDKETGYDIVATEGKWGPYVMLNGPTKAKQKTCKLVSPLTLDNITLKKAVKLLEYPKILGKCGRKNVTLHKSRKGEFYVKVGKDMSFTVESSVTLDDVKKLVKNKEKSVHKVVKGSKKTYTIQDGPYGTYMKVVDKKTKKAINVGIDKDFDPKTLTEEIAEELINKYFNQRKGYYKKSYGKYKKTKKS